MSEASLIAHQVDEAALLARISTLREEVARLRDECSNEKVARLRAEGRLIDSGLREERLRLLLRTAADSLSGPHPVLRTEIDAALAGSAPAAVEPPVEKCPVCKGEGSFFGYPFLRVESE